MIHFDFDLIDDEDFEENEGMIFDICVDTSPQQRNPSTNPLVRDHLHFSLDQKKFRCQ